MHSIKLIANQYFFQGSLETSVLDLLIDCNLDDNPFAALAPRFPFDSDHTSTGGGLDFLPPFGPPVIRWVHVRVRV